MYAAGLTIMADLYMIAGGVVAFVATLLAAYLRGGAKAKKDITDKIIKGTAAREETRDEIDDDVRQLDAASELRDKWSRPKSG